MLDNPASVADSHISINDDVKVH